MTPSEQFDRDVKRDVQARVREGVKAVLEADAYPPVSREEGNLPE